MRASAKEQVEMKKGFASVNTRGAAFVPGNGACAISLPVLSGIHYLYPAMHRPISILMLDGQAPYALLVVRCLVRATGVRLHVLSFTAHALTRHARGIASFECLPMLKDPDMRLDLVERVVRKHGVDVIIASSEDAIEFISANHEALRGLCATVAVPGTKELAIARDKGLFSRHMAAHSLPHPATCIVSNDPGFLSAVAALKPPLILKPVSASGGDGVLKFADHESLLAHMRSTPLPEKRFIVQAYVHGRDGGCNVLCRDGKVLVSTVQKSVVSNPREYGAPSCVDVVRDDKVLAEVARVMESLNWSGAANVDLKLDEAGNSVTVLEINPRYWGSLLASLYSGVNFPYLACLEGMGSPLPEMQFRPVRFTWHKRRLIAGFLAPKGTEQIESRGTILRYLLPDPLPELVDFTRRKFQR